MQVRIKIVLYILRKSGGQVFTLVSACHLSTLRMKASDYDTSDTEHPDSE